MRSISQKVGTFKFGNTIISEFLNIDIQSVRKVVRIPLSPLNRVQSQMKHRNLRCFFFLIGEGKRFFLSI